MDTQGAMAHGPLPCPTQRVPPTTRSASSDGSSRRATRCDAPRDHLPRVHALQP